MTWQDELEDVIRRLDYADQHGDKRAVSEIRRYAAKKWGADLYRDGFSGAWKLAMATRHPSDEDSTDRQKMDGPTSAEPAGSDEMSKRDKETAFRRLDERYREMAAKEISEALNKGEFKVPDRATWNEARRRMQEYKEYRHVHRDDHVDAWKHPPHNFWQSPFADTRNTPSPSQPPPPELPPDVHTPTEEETMAAVNDFFNQEIS